MKIFLEGIGRGYSEWILGGFHGSITRKITGQILKVTPGRFIGKNRGEILERTFEKTLEGIIRRVLGAIPGGFFGVFFCYP